ncbi:hypothetical protein CORC01_00869 [Colletotrichum orchidophilum]|uniref:Uncharacterized protein n=1 Tax=Colletotrichum orchidophilum TaxID=1209926 RepID=A0A1G4BRV9_9PEZI|nr:uncharacterized protein CORC01_00869 [Colletotrichum orchidophilum]OHF04007.1 hypothetical protein CORC01_00869 [Colletotrichum orchidophilum]
MRFSLVTLFSYVASVLAGRYIVFLAPSTDIDKFVGKLLLRDSDLKVITKWDNTPGLYGVVVDTNVWNVWSIRKFREVRLVQEDELITLPPQPTAGLPTEPEDTPFPLPSAT